jgi:phenylalanyl-tRNA synthetase alpha subunit
VEELLELLDWQMNNVGKGQCADGELKYEVRGKRFSGDVNTALGNCMIMTGMVYAYARYQNVMIELVNNGDDCTVIMERDDLERFLDGLSEWFLEMGFRMTVEKPVYELSQIEFCQMHPIRVKEGTRMVRNIPTVLHKDVLSIIPLTSEKLARKWMYAVGDCGLALCTGIPILQEFYSALKRNGLESNIAKNPAMDMYSKNIYRKNMESKWRPVEDMTRIDVMDAWGILPDEQVAHEEYLRNWTFEFGVRSVESHEEYETIQTTYL